MFIHRENAPKRPSTYVVLFYTRKSLLKKILIQNLIKIFTKTHPLAYFLKTFSRGSMPPSMCAADIIISI